MKTCTAVRCAAFGLSACLSATACPASPPPPRLAADGSWLSRTLAAREAALSHAYNTCNLHALRASLFAGTTIETPDGRHIDPLIEARERICGHLRRQVIRGSLSVRAVGDDSALVNGRQRFCAIGASPCAEQGSKFSQLWTLDRGHWRLAWMRGFTDAMQQARHGVAVSHAPGPKGQGQQTNAPGPRSRAHADDSRCKGTESRC